MKKLPENRGGWGAEHPIHPYFPVIFYGAAKAQIKILSTNHLVDHRFVITQNRDLLNLTFLRGKESSNVIRLSFRISRTKFYMHAHYFQNWREFIKYSEDEPQPQPIYSKDQLRVVLVGLKAGQAIPPQFEGLAVYYFLEGNGHMCVENEWFSVHPGVIMIPEEGTIRRIQADTDLAFFATRVTTMHLHRK